MTVILQPETCNLHLLLIGYGNPLRRDDGAGIALANALAAQWQAQGVRICQHTVTQLAPELALAVADPAVEAVIFVDAANTPKCGGLQVRRLDPHRKPATASPSLGHHMDPTLLLEYAGLFTQQLPPAWLITISGTDFGLGLGFSVEVTQALTSAARIAAGLLKQIEYNAALEVQEGEPICTK